jgi:hypothetical protein
VVECLPSKCEVLSSNPCTGKKKKSPKKKWSPNTYYRMLSLERPQFYNCDFPKSHTCMVTPHNTGLGCRPKYVGYTVALVKCLTHGSSLWKNHILLQITRSYTSFEETLIWATCVKKKCALEKEVMS